MKYLRYVALLALLALPLAYSQAEVRVGIGFGGYVAGPPVCAYGYYADYPYACAPYGYYGPTWFANGIFIGAGPWYNSFGRHITVARLIAAFTDMVPTVVVLRDVGLMDVVRRFGAASKGAVRARASAEGPMAEGPMEEAGAAVNSTYSNRTGN